MTVEALPNITTVFQNIKRHAQSQWLELWHNNHSVIMVGMATCGRAAGALEVTQALRNEIKKQNLNCPVIEVGCLGHCYAEPLIIISKPGYPPICYGYVNLVIAERLVRDFILGDNPRLEFALAAMEENDLVPSFLDFPRANLENKVILSNCGQIDPKQINHYLANEGYTALVKVLGMLPSKVIAQVKKAELRGLGGAGFPTGQKWESCYEARGKVKYIIGNGDEGDPGAFMDRSILESDPHSVIEGMVIAGYAIGAKQGYIYVRAEYPLAIEHVQTALHQAKKINLLGKHILGSDFSFNIKLFQGSGAFVCGEETALISSIEGASGMPHYRPPYPTISGLNKKPTVINNIKTLANIRHIINNGPKWFVGIGTKNSKGTAVFALAGKILNTGLVEVPMGTTLRQIIFDVGGGIPNGKHLKAVQIGGPSGGCIPESTLNLPIDFDSLNESGAMMGSGGMVVLDECDCMVEIARYFLEFTQRESCGKCTFCRLGTKQMLEILSDITQGQGKLEDLDVLDQLAEDVKSGSLCGMGKTAPNPILTTLHFFRDEYKAHIVEGRCPALMCQKLIAYYVVREKCERSCDACVGTCTVEAISADKKRIKVIDQEKCVKCGTCLDACPPQYNAIIKLSPPDKVPESKPINR
ncbi:NADH-ubiquinone oxidoreductase-F iron-sulfur binding region domain-containing protein [Chloroflexota bacterium]